MKNIVSFILMIFLFVACNMNMGNGNKEISSDTVDTTETIYAANSNHLAFKGIPIDGTLKQFVSRMEKAGFSEITQSDTPKGTYVLRGDFAGYKDCQVNVSTLEGTDVVSSILVAFPNQETWQYLYGDYMHLKEMLTEKYGNPSSVKEFFQDKYINDDSDKMYAVRFDKCKYSSRFVTEKGDIILWIEHADWYTFVCLQYTDKINANTVKQQAISDL